MKRMVPVLLLFLMTALIGFDFALGQEPERFRDLGDRATPSPNALLNRLQRYQRTPIQSTPLYSELQKVGRDIFQTLSPEERLQAQKFAEQLLRNKGFDSPEVQSLMDQMGVDPELQSRLKQELGANKSNQNAGLPTTPQELYLENRKQIERKFFEKQLEDVKRRSQNPLANLWAPDQSSQRPPEAERESTTSGTRQRSGRSENRFNGSRFENRDSIGSRDSGGSKFGTSNEQTPGTGNRKPFQLGSAELKSLQQSINELKTDDRFSDLTAVQRSQISDFEKQFESLLGADASKAGERAEPARSENRNNGSLAPRSNDRPVRAQVSGQRPSNRGSGDLDLDSIMQEIERAQLGASTNPRQGQPEIADGSPGFRIQGSDASRSADLTSGTENPARRVSSRETQRRLREAIRRNNKNRAQASLDEDRDLLNDQRFGRSSNQNSSNSRTGGGRDGTADLNPRDMTTAGKQAFDRRQSDRSGDNNGSGAKVSDEKFAKEFYQLAQEILPSVQKQMSQNPDSERWKKLKQALSDQSGPSESGTSIADILKGSKSLLTRAAADPKTREKVEARFDRMLMNAAKSTIKRAQEGKDDSFVSKTLNRVLDSAVDSAKDKYREFKNDRRQRNNRNANNRSRSSQVNERSRESVSPLAGITEQLTGQRTDQNSFRSNGASGAQANSSSPTAGPLSSSDLWSGISNGLFSWPVLLTLLSVIAGVVIAFLILTQLNGPADSAEIRKQKLAQKLKASIRDPDDVVDAVDLYLLAHHGESANWWSAEFAKDKIASQQPQLKDRIINLFNVYVLFRYAPENAANSELDDAERELAESTLQELVQQDKSIAPESSSGVTSGSSERTQGA